MRGPHAMAQVYQALILGPLISRIGSQRMCMLTLKPSGQDLAFLRELIEGGKVKPVVDRRYTLEQVVEALEYYERGHAQGKVVITI